MDTGIDGVAAALGGWLGAALWLATIGGVLLLELRWPAAARRTDPPGRLRANLLLGTATLLIQAAVPFGTAALTAAGQGAGVVGLLPALGVAGWTAAAVSFALASLSQYGFHRAAHRWAWLWRLHRVHHSDTALDITTSFRHHPGEAIVATAWLTAVALALGLSPAALTIYGVVALLSGVMQHADLAWPGLERLLGGWLMTPAAHRLHHSAAQPETDSNFGDVVTLWDRLFGSWRRGGPVAAIGLGPDADIDAHRVRRQVFGRFGGPRLQSRRQDPASE